MSGYLIKYLVRIIKRGKTMSIVIKKSIFVKSIKTEYPLFCFSVQRYCSAFLIKEDEAPASLRLYDPLVENEVFAIIDIPMPLLKTGDYFYFEDSKTTVKIEGVLRTSEDNVVYVIETSFVYDEEAKRQYDEDKEQYMNVKTLRDKIHKLENRGLVARILNKID